MKTRHILLSLLATAGLLPASALDLTPPSRLHPPTFRELEGVKIPIVVLKDGLRRVEWQPPAGWELRGDATLLTLRPEGQSRPAMELRLIPAKAARAPEADTAAEEFAKWARPFLPGDAENVTLVSEAPSPFLLGGLPSRELTFTYMSLSHPCTTSIGLVNLGDELALAVVIRARSADFAAVHTAGTESMFRWNWIGPAPERIASRSPAASDPAGSIAASAGSGRER